MAAHSPKIQSFIDLWSAHRELSTLEWLEFRQSVVSALIWLGVAALGGLSGWMAVNAAIVLAFRQDPLRAAIAVAGVNLLFAIVGGLQMRRLLKRPFFALTKREALKDVSSVLEVMT